MLTASHRLSLLRLSGFCCGAILILFVVLSATAELTRPSSHAVDLIAGAISRLSEPSPTATAVSLDGEVRSDVAAIIVQRALTRAATPLDRSTAVGAAQEATLAALAVSPVNAPMWLALGLLRAPTKEATAPLKVSYLTGPLPRDAVLRRLQAVTSGSAADDEEIALLAQADVRSLLTVYADRKVALTAVYRQATRSGKALIIAAADLIDGGFATSLRQIK